MDFRAVIWEVAAKTASPNVAALRGAGILHYASKSGLKGHTAASLSMSEGPDWAVIATACLPGRRLYKGRYLRIAAFGVQRSMWASVC